MLFPHDSATEHFISYQTWKHNFTIHARFVSFALHYGSTVQLEKKIFYNRKKNLFKYLYIRQDNLESCFQTISMVIKI